MSRGNSVIRQLQWMLFHVKKSNGTTYMQYVYVCVYVLVAQLSLTLRNPMDCSLPRLLCPWNSPGKSTGMGFHFLLQGIFPTQGWNPSLLQCRQILYHLSHQVSPMQYISGQISDQTSHPTANTSRDKQKGMALRIG